MAPGFQSSFIPKGPATEEVFKKKKAGVLGVLVVSLFVSMIILSIAMVAYKSILKSDISNLQSQLATSVANIDKKSIEDMVSYSKKLSIVKSIVFKHQVISGFLNSLASSTVSTVSFNDFGYDSLPTGGLSVNMKGKTNSYGSVALQESVFSKNKYWDSVSFSNLNLSDKGAVSFEVKVSVDPKIAIYAPPIVTLPSPTSSSTAKSSISDTATNVDDLNKINSEINNL